MEEDFHDMEEDTYAMEEDIYIAEEDNYAMEEDVHAMVVSQHDDKKDEFKGLNLGIVMCCNDCITMYIKVFDIF